MQLNHGRFVAGDLGIVAENKTNISLGDIEFSIGKAFAAVYWYGMYPDYVFVYYSLLTVDFDVGRNYNYSEPHGLAIVDRGNNLPVHTVTEEQGEAIIMVSILKLRMNVSNHSPSKYRYN